MKVLPDTVAREDRAVARQKRARRDVESGGSGPSRLVTTVAFVGVGVVEPVEDACCSAWRRCPAQATRQGTAL